MFSGVSTDQVPEFKLAPQERRVFIGLLVGMLVSSISQTIVGPAMPRIVAELGGMEHYSWVATAAMLVTAVTVPIVGKLSDLFGRRGFYLGGLVVFMIGSIVSGLSQSFGMLIVGRASQGLGMGTLMPLSQTIVGDIIPPRQRGKYQGLMGPCSASRRWLAHWPAVSSPTTSAGAGCSSPACRLACSRSTSCIATCTWATPVVRRASTTPAWPR